MNVPVTLKDGDTFTIAGVYAKRSFWQWLRGDPRRLQLFTAKALYQAFDRALLGAPLLSPPIVIPQGRGYSRDEWL